MTLRSMSALGASASVVAALAGVAACSGSGSSALPPPGVRPAPGWVVIKPGRTEPSVSAQMVVAVTAPDADALQPFAPFTGFTRLGRRGILVWATTLGRTGRKSPFPSFARAKWPLRLSTFRLDRGWEGQPAPNIQQRLRAAAVGGWNLDVRVYFATQHPDRKLVGDAQAELRRLLLPRPH